MILGDPHLTPVALLILIVAAWIVGLSKTGVPGVGILAVPLMAAVLGGRLSVGTLLPLLVVGDLFAVTWYRRHADLKQIKLLAPCVLIGLALGSWLLLRMGEHPAHRDLMNPMIGVIVLLILGLTLIRGKLGDKFQPHSRTGAYLTGVAAGFTTMVSNAAGPIMVIYFSALGFAKTEFMGTQAVYFFLFNLVKVPILIGLTLATPGQPLLTAHTLLIDGVMAPAVALGAWSGKWVLHKLPEKAFSTVVLALAALAALELIFG